MASARGFAGWYRPAGNSDPPWRCEVTVGALPGGGALISTNLAGYVEGAARLQGSDLLEVICECRPGTVCVHQAIASELVYAREEWFRGPELLAPESPEPWEVVFRDPSGEEIWRIERWNGHQFEVNYRGRRHAKVDYLRRQWTCLDCARNLPSERRDEPVLRCVHTELLAHGPIPKGRITAAPDEP